MLKDEIPLILEEMRQKAPLFTHNAQLFNIYEGDLVTYVLEDLRNQLSDQSFDGIKHRISPINVLNRVLAKLSQIYSKPPQRELSDPNDKDKDLFNYYLKSMDVNTNMQISNEFFNLFKNTLIEPFVHEGVPRLREIPSDRFYVWSNDLVDPTRPTHVVKHMGKIKPRGKDEQEKQVFYFYTDTEFLPVDSDGNVLTNVLAGLDNPGTNPIGKLPFVYVNRSRHSLIPTPDTDTLRMTKLFPVLLSDLNFAVMYQCFSILFAINIKQNNLKLSPNVVWFLQSDPAGGGEPEVGSIKPQVDVQQVIGFIVSQLSFWLQSKSIRPGSVGEINPESFSSGISKIVDEMDTYEDRQKQIPYFVQAENDLWNLIINHLHPYWVRTGQIDERRLFDPGQSVLVTFPPQRPATRRAEIIADVEKELALSLTTRREAMTRLNPDMTDLEVDEFMGEIEKDMVEIPQETPPEGPQGARGEQEGEGSVG